MAGGAVREVLLMTALPSGAFWQRRRRFVKNRFI